MSAVDQQHGEKQQPKSPGDAAHWPPSWNTMPHGINVGRYIDPAFQQIEYKRLWTRVWQVAARVDEIPEINDYTTYEIGDQSVVVVRVDQTTIKAFHNVCPHRGTAFAQGCGTFANGRIICPFHGWRWDTAGKNHFVLEREEFRGGQLRDSDVALKEVKVAVWAGFVFISFDASPQPFDEFIAPVRQFVEDLAIADMHHYWWKSMTVSGNWKMAQEAFFEGYHVPATHPQLEKLGAEVIYGNRSAADTPFGHRNTAYDALQFGHGRFYVAQQGPVKGTVAAAGDPVEAMAVRLQLL
ncbi:MAG TPA: aromatic ring-hydroxylating dioxygenase subunit alpha, partial [Bryobacteraceae bacterium]|nr:aromatic ring-hydroxylating dioxygenase subunit alpha [Bryobacteraceae bacterium]